jgi:hypothetical protein
MTAAREFAHEQVCRVRDLDGDPAALGGAVTVALCGHWEHDGPCRWPHHNETRRDGDDVLLTVRFDATDDDVAEVRDAITRAVAGGASPGPDGRVSRWSV